MDKLFELAIEAARGAGTAVMSYYQQALAVEHKQDGSPLTLADQAARHVIADQLSDSEVNVYPRLVGSSE